jgi:class 3 adenylate cyclase/tetratricopeptide (TPR) repeat protein
MPERASALVTILFTDLVGSTELLSRAGDESAQRIFRAHHSLLASTAADHRGEEVKWLGDGLMVAFASTLDALRAAIAMQQASRRPVEGEVLSIRVGLNAGETMRDATDYFGTPVVVARRLCDKAEGGQILCTETVVGLLAGRSEFAFTDLGKLALKGVPEPVAASEVRYEAAESNILAARVAMVGREAELSRLSARLAEAAAGRGGLAMLTGGAGIGKTRMLEELAERAAHQGTTVLSGACFESEWAPPYAPFADALGAYLATADPEELRADLGAGAAPLAQLVPVVRQVLTDVGDPAPVQPDEERFRLLDAVAQFLLARARRAPVLLCLDDLHWADKGTVAMLRHVARTAAHSRVLLLGAYRHDEVGRGHPLADALGALPRETDYESVALAGLGAEGVSQLLAELGEHEVSERVGAAWARETDGNPFFVKELLHHLFEEGHLIRGPDGRWTTDRPLRELTLPKGVRDVLVRRLSRLSEPTGKLLTVASVFEGPFAFETLAAVAGLDEDDALDALEGALAAQVLAPAGGADTYGFAHNLFRHTVYDEVSAPRRVRYHRRAAEALEAAYGERPTPAQAGEMAAQYHASRSLPGAERGVGPALLAADHSEAVGAFPKAEAFLRIALDLLPADDDRRPRLLGRLGTTLAWALAFEDAAATAAEAGQAIAAAEGAGAAAEYLSAAAYTCAMAGGVPYAWGLASQGLGLPGERRDVAWARLVAFDHQRRETEDPDHPGIPLDTPDRGEAARILRDAHLDPLGPAPMEAVFGSRDEALASSNLGVLSYWAGEYAGTLPRLEAEAERALARGQITRAARCWAIIGMVQCALGHLDDARHGLDEAHALAARVGQPNFTVLQAQEMLTGAFDEGFEELIATLTPLTATNTPALAWALGPLYAYLLRASARLGQDQPALRYLGLLAPWLERAPAWTVGFPAMACHAAEALWTLERLDHAAVVEYAVREKVILPDFRSPMVDGRLALARLCALQGRHEETEKWLGEARRVLDEQGALPLLAICDFDEALTLSRRGGPRDAERARPVLERARSQFEDLAMTGWLHRADEMLARL